MSSATQCQPAYLSAWTIDCPLPDVAQHTLRAARTNGGSCAHHRQTRPAVGCPHRSHCGCGRSRNRDQQHPHTMPGSCAPRAPRQVAQRRGSRRSARAAPATRTPRHAIAAVRSRLATSRRGRGPCRTSARRRVHPARRASAARPLRDGRSPGRLGRRRSHRVDKPGRVRRRER